MTQPTTAVRRVLIVDDADDLRGILRVLIDRAEELQVVGEAVDGLDAVEQARLLQPDVVLLDVAMPRMDGLQALPLIREVVPDARVIMLSGFNEGTMAESARRAGADHYVVKGSSPTELIELAAAP